MTASFRALRRLCVFPAAMLVAFILPSCGGGGGADLYGAPTVRPKTLASVTLALDSFVRFLFIPNTDVPTAIENGDVEVGAFQFLRIETEFDARPYPNGINGQTNTTFPIDITEGVYTYTGINNNQALLTMTGIGLEPSPIKFETPPGRIPTNSINGGLMGLFTYDSSFPSVPTNLVHILMSFEVAGGFVNLSQVRVFQPESTSSPAYDDVFVTVSDLSLSGNQGVPENYLGEEDIDGYGNIVVETLNLKAFNLVSGADPSFNFKLDFVREVDDLFPGVDGSLPEETGTCAVTVKNAGVDFTIPGGAQYSWRRIPGTNTGELILSGIPDFGLPNDNELNNNKFILSYEALDAGTYAGFDANRSGSFVMIDTVTPP